MTKKELPEGSYVTIGRKFALGGVLSIIVAGGASLASILLADAKQSFKIEQLEHKVIKLETGYDRDRTDISEIRSDIRVIRILLEGKDPPQRQNK